MKTGFDNLAARRKRGVVVDRDFIRHGIRYNKAAEKLFRLRQYTLNFDRRESEQ